MERTAELGHRWLATSSRILASDFPRVCARCLVRDDRPLAGQPCDASWERIDQRAMSSRLELDELRR